MVNSAVNKAVNSVNCTLHYAVTVMRSCGQCGNSVNAVMLSCGQCGHAVNAVMRSMRSCGQCGHSVNAVKAVMLSFGQCGHAVTMLSCCFYPVNAVTMLSCCLYPVNAVMRSILSCGHAIVWPIRSLRCRAVNMRSCGHYAPNAVIMRSMRSLRSMRSCGHSEVMRSVMRSKRSLFGNAFNLCGHAVRKGRTQCGQCGHPVLPACAMTT